MLKASEILKLLSLYRHRGCGSEEEMLAREELMAMLVGENGVEVKEEGFHAPASYLPFFWVIFLGMIFSVYISAYSALSGIVGILLFGISFILFMDWRRSPLIWFYAPKVTANLVAEKVNGTPNCPLVIIMAHLDSAPASFAYRQNQVPHFKLSTLMTLGMIGLSVFFPMLSFMGLEFPSWVINLYCIFLFVILLLMSVDYWLYGYTPGANDNLTGVAAATEIAGRLFRDMPENTDIRLLITSAEEAGMLGSQHYLAMHREELTSRPVYVLNIDTVGAGRLCYVSQTGTLTNSYYSGKVIEAANGIAKTDERFNYIKPAVHNVGDFDSVWFMRAGIPSLTLGAYDNDGIMSRIHTPEDRIDYVSMSVVNEAIDYGEAIVRNIRE